MLKATVYSIYMDNVQPDVVAAQRSVVEAFLPAGWKFVQHKPAGYSHPAHMHVCLSTNANPLTVFLDIDCVPLSVTALETLADRASHGILAGAVQRANHIENGGHIYVGPFCMAFDNKRYVELGSPSFFETPRGDVGEEVTWRWQERRAPVWMLYPSKVANPLWTIDEKTKFGLGTEYDGKFYHEFCIRNRTGEFVNKCGEILNSNLRGVTV